MQYTSALFLHVFLLCLPEHSLQRSVPLSLSSLRSHPAGITKRLDFKPGSIAIGAACGPTIKDQGCPDGYDCRFDSPDGIRDGNNDHYGCYPSVPMRRCGWHSFWIPKGNGENQLVQERIVCMDGFHCADSTECVGNMSCRDYQPPLGPNEDITPPIVPGICMEDGWPGIASP